MKSAPIGFIAGRLLAGRRVPGGRADLARRALSGAILSIGLSLVPLITVMQVADGMIRGISARYVELGTYHAQAHAYAPGADWAAAKEAALAAPGVRGAWLETQSVGVAFANGRREGAAIRAVDPGFLADPGSAEFLEVRAGEASLEAPNDVLVGSAMADKLGLAVGDQLNLITVRRTGGGEPQPRVSIFTVRGIVSAGYRELDSQWLFIRQDAALRFLPRESSRTILGVKGDEPFGQASGLPAALSSALPPGFSVYDWKELQRNLFESLASTRTLLLLIMAITVAVASVNVSSALTTLVLERRQEIATLKSLGARPEDLARAFSLGGAILGASGALLGCAGGLLVSLRVNELIHGLEWLANAARRLVSALGRAPAAGAAHGAARILDPGYYLERIPVDVAYGDLAAVVAATVLLSFLAALLPARRAAVLDPMEAFRRR